MNDQSAEKAGTIVYFSHGGGPMPLLGDQGHEKMIAFMRELPSTIPDPDEILVISAHWEESVPTAIGHENPSLYYDYYGFPEETYHLQYPVKGNPSLAENICGLLNDKGIQSEIILDRGFDHGLFIPLMMMYPKADIPVTQLSLIKGLDPTEHLALGKALKGLTDTNILIIGSGFSFHNMGAFSMGAGQKEDQANDEFQNWLSDVCCGTHSPLERENLLKDWSQAPFARYCHPREEHLLPLHVCYGMAGTCGEIIFDDYILGKRALALRW